jgi:hypothetical protein
MNVTHSGGLGQLPAAEPASADPDFSSVTTASNILQEFNGRIYRPVDFVKLSVRRPLTNVGHWLVSTSFVATADRCD